MASLNPPCLMVKIFVVSFSIAIFALAIAICEAKHLKTLPQTSLNPKSYLDHSLDYTPILDSNNCNLFVPRYNLMIQGIISSISKSFEDFDENGPLSREISTRDKHLQSATASCRELLSLASYNLNISSPTRDSVLTRKTLVDFKTYLCGTMAYIDTCLDAFEYAPEKARNIVVASLESSRKNVSDTLSILSTIDDHNLDSLMDGGFGRKKPKNAWAWPPSWMAFEENKLLLDSSKATGVDVVVAKDGSGRFKTISEAINFAPQNSQKRFVIYVKQGKYYENVKVDANKWNIMIFGDGMDKTIVSGMLSNTSGISTIGTATFAVYGRGFIARDIGFENTAGPYAKQAVALLLSSDQSIIYKCGIHGYQDTLFSASHRQFFRECRISGTVDFIFGQSSAVFQGCTILVRKPLHGQVNTVTAQGKSDPRCPSGFSIQKSYVLEAENLAGVRTFLGRAWRSYATTVFMESYLGGFIDPLGWSGWEVVGVPPETVYYGEFVNKGSGAATHGRVKCKGVRENMSFREAQTFTVKEFIGGQEWLPATGVPSQLNL